MTYLQSRPFHAYLVCCVLVCYSLACFSIRPFASSLWKCVNAWGWPWRVVAVPLNPSLKPLWRVSSSTLLENCPPRMVRSPVAARHTLAPNTCTHSVTVRLCFLLLYVSLRRLLLCLSTPPHHMHCCCCCLGDGGGCCGCVSHVPFSSHSCTVQDHGRWTARQHPPHLRDVRTKPASRVHRLQRTRRDLQVVHACRLRRRAIVAARAGPPLFQGGVWRRW